MDDAERFEHWLEEHYRRLLGYARYQCRGYVNQDTDAQDLLQQAILAVVEQRIRIDWARSPLTLFQWLLRRTKREIFFPPMEGWSSNLNEELWDAFSLWRAELTAAQEEALQLHLQGYSLGQIAQALHITGGSVQDRLRQVVIKMRRLRKQALAPGAGGPLDDSAHSNKHLK